MASASVGDDLDRARRVGDDLGIAALIGNLAGPRLHASKTVTDLKRGRVWHYLNIVAARL